MYYLRKAITVIAGSSWPQAAFCQQRRGLGLYLPCPLGGLPRDHLRHVHLLLGTGSMYCISGAWRVQVYGKPAPARVCFYSITTAWPLSQPASQSHVSSGMAAESSTDVLRLLGSSTNSNNPPNSRGRISMCCLQDQCSPGRLGRLLSPLRGFPTFTNVCVPRMHISDVDASDLPDLSYNVETVRQDQGW
ncbi:hypothetical protein F4780DRAFT_742323 [Xylariomycetidae sp. FL0641]|nr:hypothetical protein F4780DRAFT_742323 [Xylariomycetidae sp. FL0641]